MKLMRFNILLLLGCLVSLCLGSCSKVEEPDYREKDYGYVQFKLYKEASYEGTKAVVEELDYLSDVSKIMVTLKYGGKTMSQTLVLSAASDEAAEYGLRSEKLQLMAGSYTVVMYSLYDKVDNVIYEDTPSSASFEVSAGGLTVHDVLVNVTPRGQVRFTLVKDMSGFDVKSAAREYSFDEIEKVDVVVKETTTGLKTTFKNLLADFDIHFTDDGVEDGYQTSSSICDTILSLKAGRYVIDEYAVYDANKKLLERNSSVKEDAFEVKDNELTEADVPVRLNETDARIKDYYALKDIWEALNGEDWYYVGENFAKGANWDFNKDIDLWGDQPGVQIHTNGRVAYVDISDFGFYGPLNDEQRAKFESLGQLTEIVELFFGTHNDSNKYTYDAILDGDPSKSRMERHKEYLSMIHPSTQMSEPIARAFMEHGITFPEIAMYKEFSEDELIEKGTGMMLNRPELKDMNYGVLCNGLTSLPESIGNLTKLEKMYVANGKLTGIPESIAKLDNLTDLEIYNCPEMKEFPMAVTKMKGLVSLLISNNYQWTADELYKGLDALAKGPSNDDLQMLYVNYNNLEKVPASFSNLHKLGLLDLSNNKISEIEAAFGQNVNIVQCFFDNNQITSFPKDEEGMFFGIADVETFSARNNRLTKFPNIFDANSIYSMASVDFSYNQIDGFEDEEKGYGPEGYRGIKVSTLTINNNLTITEYPMALTKSNSLLTNLSMRGCSISSIPEGAFEYENAIDLMSLDLSYNHLTDFPKDMHSGNLPYLYGVDISYNRFSSFPFEPLDSSYLTVFAIRGQRNANGERCLSEWPTGLYNHKGLRGFYIGSNNLGLIDDTISYLIYYLDISDNPNIVFDASDICSAYYSGTYYLIYDQTQDIRNCDILFY